MKKTINDIQKNLNDLYIEKLDKKFLASIKDQEKLSAPLLIKAYQSYIDAPIKIMYVGKETNHWLTHHSIEPNKRGLIGAYDEKDNLNTDRLLDRYNKRMTQQHNWKKSALFNQYKNIKDQLVDNEVGSGSVVWNNLFKMAYDRGKGYSKSSLGHSIELQQLSKQIFLEELQILKPEIIIFVTGSSYDTVIKDYFTKYETLEIVIPKKLWKFKYKNILCYRTAHPDSIRFTKKENREDYYQMLINDIKKEYKV